MSTKETLKKIACATIDAERSALIGTSQILWKNPELAYEEHKSAKLLADFLSERHFEVRKEYHLPTSFRAEYGDCSSGGPNIGVMCEYDALPEIGHACGHNLIAQVGIGAGIGIKAALEQTNMKNVKVTVLGCPAEEDGGGKVDLIRAGAFQDIDVAMMCHPGIFNAPSTIILAMQQVVVKYKGKASHAAGFPWKGVNALDAAVMCYTSVSCMRQQLRPEWRVHGIITKGGAKPNIIPEEAELLYYVRAPTLGQLEELKAKVKCCFDSAAIATGCEVSYDWGQKPYENMLSNSLMEAKYRNNALDLGLSLCDDKEALSKPTGSTDMGNVSHVVPSIHGRFDIKPTGVAHSRPFQVAAGTDFAHDASIIQSKVLAMTAIDILLDAVYLEQIKDQFHKDVLADTNMD